MPTAILNHICLQTRNFKDSIQFYQEYFNAQIVHEWGTVGEGDHAIILKVGENVTFEVFEDHSNHAEHGIWDHIAFTTKDIKAAFKRAEELGAKIVVEPQFSDIPTFDGSFVYMYFGYLQSPGGEVFELIEEVNDGQLPN